VRSQTASEVLLDASTLCHFARHGRLPELRAYLGGRASITREVERELLRLLQRPEFASLADHLVRDGATARASGKWPKRTKNLPAYLKPEFARLLRLKRAIGEHERAHAGEIATVLMAKHRQSGLVVIDDNWGGDLASKTYGSPIVRPASPRTLLEQSTNLLSKVRKLST
jgi:hypothetical protein